MKTEEYFQIAQKELFDVVSACTLFLKKNGMPMNQIKKMIDEIVQDSISQIEKIKV